MSVSLTVTVIRIAYVYFAYDSSSLQRPIERQINFTKELAGYRDTTRESGALLTYC